MDKIHVDLENRPNKCDLDIKMKRKVHGEEAIHEDIMCKIFPKPM